MRHSSLSRSLLVLAQVGLFSSMSASSHAFTLIPIDPLLVKMSTGAPPADNSSSTTTRPRYSVSDDGCWIVFTSFAKNLLSGQVETNGGSDVFLYHACPDLKVVAIVSHKNGSPSTTSNGISDQPVISPDGNFVVFQSTATDIVEFGGLPGPTNVFLWDRNADTFQLASHGTGGVATPGDGHSRNGVISRTPGRPFVAFESDATNLDPNKADKNDATDVFRYDSTTTDVARVSAPNNTGLESDGASINPAIDGSGACIAFESKATNLASDDPADDQNGGIPASDVFRWKSAAGIIVLSHTAGVVNTGKGSKTAAGDSTEPSISDDCKRFAFKSTAKDLMSVQNDSKGFNDVFYSGDTGDAVLASHVDGDATTAGSDASDAPILSRDGNWIAYASLAKDLSPGQADSGTTSDVFVHDVAKNANTLASHRANDPKTTGSGESFAPEISTNGLYVAFESDAKDLDPNQVEGTGGRDIFLYYSRPGNSAIVVSRRFASIAITGDRPSVKPSLNGGSGNGAYVVVLFTERERRPHSRRPGDERRRRHVPVQDPRLAEHMSARSTDTRNTIEWVTPPVNYVRMELWVNPSATCPSTYSTAVMHLIGAPSPVANAIGQFADPASYPLAADRCYSIFIERDDGPILSTDGPDETIVARTLDVPLGTARWTTNLNDATQLAQVGLGQNLIAVGNDGGVYGLSRGPSGGFWAPGYRPFRNNIAPIQGRPPVFNMSVNGSTQTTFVGSQDGRAYAYDSDRGAGPGAGARSGTRLPGLEPSFSRACPHCSPPSVAWATTS